jgi:hypothetical protein
MDNIPRDWLITFAGIGITISGFAIFALLASLFVVIKEKIIFVLKRYRDKHYVKIPIKPKCYCVQCDYWHRSNQVMDSGPCEIWDKWTSADETCSRGKLRTEQQYKNEEYRMETK